MPMSGENNKYGYDPNIFNDVIKTSQDIHYEEMDNAVTDAAAEQAEAQSKEDIENVMDDTRDALKAPMGPVNAPIVGDDETADKYGEGDGARDENDDLIPGYPGDVNRK